MKEQSMRVGDRHVAIDQITEVSFFLDEEGDCWIDVTVEGELGQTGHAGVQFGSDSDAAAHYARKLMSKIWPGGWLFSEQRHYYNCVAWCHVKASVDEQDIEKQKPWLLMFVPDLNVHSVIDQRHVSYLMCKTTAREVTM